MNPLSYYLIAIFLLFMGIGIYAKLTANPKPRKKIVPEPQPRYCTLAEALSLAWLVFDDPQENKRVEVSYNGVLCCLIPDFGRRGIPVIWLSCSFTPGKKNMPDIILQHEDVNLPGFANILYEYPQEKEEIAKVLQKTLGVSMDKETIKYDETKLDEIDKIKDI